MKMSDYKVFEAVLKIVENKYPKLIEESLEIFFQRIDIIGDTLVFQTPTNGTEYYLYNEATASFTQKNA